MWLDLIDRPTTNMCLQRMFLCTKIYATHIAITTAPRGSYVLQVTWVTASISMLGLTLPPFPARSIPLKSREARTHPVDACSGAIYHLSQLHSWMWSPSAPQKNCWSNWRTWKTAAGLEPARSFAHREMAAIVSAIRKSQTRSLACDYV